MAPPTEKHGLFPLYPKSDVPDKNLSIDIIAVHGLGGHAFKTWTNGDGHLWLRDSLPHYVPKARIMTYGYDSAWLFSRSLSNIDDFALDLLSRLHDRRKASFETERPILFICHSLGGLVFKQALITASSQMDHYGQIFSSIRGAVFMGTPHRGSRTASPANLLSKVLNSASFGLAIRSDLFKLLKVSSSTLESISQQSVPLLKELHIVSFYEQQPLGPSLIVEPFSAILGLPNERIIPINADHRKMVHHSPKEPELYFPVWNAISGISEELSEENQTETEELLTALFSVDYKQLQMRPRQPHAGTCEWLYKDTTFRSWATCQTSALVWLSGPAGVGKSVLTRHLVEDTLAGSPNIPFPARTPAVSYFCSYNEASVNSVETILRSLLHQIVQLNPLSRTVIKLRLQKRTRKTIEYDLTAEKLWMALQEALSLDSMKNALICLDAVEELPTMSAINLLRGLSGLIGGLKTLHPDHRVRIFVSSRYVPELNKALASMYTVRFSKQPVQNDIEKFIKESLSQFAEENASFAAVVNGEKKTEIQKKIVERAGGMFLWANIAWENFKRGLLWNPDIVDKKLKKLDGLQPGLKELYAHTISQVDVSIRDDMFTMFSAIAVAERPLHPSELGIILAIQYSDSKITRSGEIYAFSDLEKMIEDNFPDLLTIDDNRRITFVHLSFKEYLCDYWEEVDPSWLQKARRKITKCCLVYLNLSDLTASARASSAVSESFPFFNYASKYLIRHLHTIPFDDALWFGFADMGHKNSIFNAERKIRYSLPKEPTWTDPYMSPLYHAVHDFTSDVLVKRFHEYGYDFNEKWRIRPSPVFAECCSRAKWKPSMERMAMLLLELGINPNNQSGGVTGLQYVIANRQTALYDKLLAHPDIDLDQRNTVGESALHYLVRFGGSQDLSRFVNHPGCKVNAQDTSGFTPLHVAISQHRKDVMEILLAAPGIQVGLTDNQGRTALTLATYWGHRDLAYAFIQNTNAFPVPEPGQLSSLVCAVIHGDKALSTKLLEKYNYSNLDDHIDLAGKGVLHHAAINDWADTLEDCLSRGGDAININMIDRSGATALHRAAALGNVASCRVLLKYGAGVRFQDRNGRTVAHVAADAGFKDVFLVLLEASDIDVTQKDHQGRNLVHWAASLDWVDVVHRILQKPGADLCLTRKDNLGKLPIDIAYGCRCPLVGRYLSSEMKRRGCTFVYPYNWDALFSKPVLSEEEEVSVEKVLKEERRRRLVDVQRQMTAEQREREDITRQYPAALWALRINNPFETAAEEYYGKEYLSGTV